MQNLIPAEVEEILLTLRDKVTTVCFQIGDITNMLYVMNVKSGKVCLKDDINKQVAYLVGKSSRTVRYYARVAEMFDEDVRDEFNMLSFAHFSLAAKIDGGSKWRSVLEYAVYGGKIKSVDAVEYYFTSQTALVAPQMWSEDTNLPAPEQMVDDYGIYQEDDEKYDNKEPEYPHKPSPQAYLRYIYDLERIANTIRRETSRAKYLEAIRTIREVLEEEGLELPAGILN